MEYREEIALRDGRACVLRNGAEEDAQAMLDVYNLTHEQTDYLLTYPDETQFTVAAEAEYLRGKTENEREIEIMAFVDGVAVGSAGITGRGSCEKLRHRAEFGVGVDRAYWGLGIGRALTTACIECAKKAGYDQLELEVVADNESACALYGTMGFVEYGRNPRGFRTRGGVWQELVLMRLELDRGC